MWYPFREAFCTLLRRGLRDRASRARRPRGTDERKKSSGKEKARREAKEGSVFLVDPPRRPLEKNSGLRRRGLFVPRRDAFGASYLRVTPCNRAPASVFSFLLSLCLSFPQRDNSLRRSLVSILRKERDRERERKSHRPRPCMPGTHLNSKKRYGRHDDQHWLSLF